MKLNKDGKNELRQMIEEQLKEVPEGERIHLDKELLENLLFDTYTEKLNDEWDVNSGNDVQVKYIVWSGAFLSKIDLSEVSFDDVLWNLDYDSENYFIKGSKNHYKDIDIIDLGGTNARIDFSKSFEGKYNTPNLFISNCNFGCVDLSNNTIDGCCILNCNFSNTNININLNSNNSIRIYNSDMSGNDLSAYKVSEAFFKEEIEIFANNCNLTNTGLKVGFTLIPSEINAAYKKLKTENDIISKEEEKMLIDQIGDYFKVIRAQQSVGEQIKSGNLDGCYVNGKKILSKEEKQEIAQAQITEYETYKQKILDSISESIKEQKNKIKS